MGREALKKKPAMGLLHHHLISTSLREVEEVAEGYEGLYCVIRGRKGRDSRPGDRVDAPRIILHDNGETGKEW